MGAVVVGGGGCVCVCVCEGGEDLLVEPAVVGGLG